jgi:hypothetical protein
MKFPMCDTMTAEQVVANKAAQKHLVRGKCYRFDPPVLATAVPTGGPNTCALGECEFDRGWYIGLVDGNHVFQGKPVNDQRVIAVPQGYENMLILDDLLDHLRDSYFLVQFTGGSSAVLDADQSHCH